MTQNNNSEPKQIKVNFKKSETFKQFYSIGALGGFSPNDFRIGFYNDTQNFDNMNEIDRVVEIEIIMAPNSLAELSAWLNNHIEEYEKHFGKNIKIQPPVANKNIPKTTPPEILQGYM